MLERLKRALVGSAREFRECRRCGTTVDRTPTRCPACGSAEIARYSL